ncbi:hypothetical protein FACS1894147_10580 [Spirochaetia bacterium]|nr:hypothetical protein FACS1894147_10580 [Spirochaetia bacterium]
MQKLRMTAVITALVTGLFFSCASASGPGSGAGKAKDAPLLPLQTGWYQYDFERTFKAIEDEYTFFAGYGMKMVQEVTYKYSGTVSYFEDGALYDPVMALELLIDDEGNISSAENASVQGTLDKDGRFFWSGFDSSNGRLNSVFVKGTLTPLPASVRGGPEFDGVYHLTDTGTGRKQLVNISNGFYTWQFIDGEETGFTPWPTLIHPDGTFSTGLEMTTVTAMGASTMNYSTSVVTQGKIVPGQSISTEEFSSTAGMGEGGAAPHVYAGAMVRAGEYPNEAIPKDIDALIKSGKEKIKAEPKIDKTKYPAWFLKPPRKTGFLYAAGEKTFDNKETALAMAKAAAAAGIAELVKVRIEETIVELTDAAGTRTDSRIQTEAMENLPYKIVEQLYNDATHTAYVLAELDLAAIQ